MDVVEIYSIEEAAEMLGITADTLRQTAHRKNTHKGFRLIRAGKVWVAVKAPGHIHVQGTTGPFLPEVFGDLPSSK